MKTYRAIKRGVKLGLSIGAKVDKVSKKKGDGGEDTYVIESVKLLETSVVGIPANQRSYLQNALKSLKQAEQSGEIQINEKAGPEDLSEGDYVRWDSSGGSAQGRIEHVMREGVLGVPDSEFRINATPEDPAALIRIYRPQGNGWRETDTLVGHKFSTLRKIEKLNPAEDIDKDAQKAAPDGIQTGDYVNWSVGGQLAYGEVEEIITRGSVTLPGSEESVEASPEDPVAVVCVYAPHGEDWENSGVYVAVKFSALTRSNPPAQAEEDEETEMSETEKDLVAGEVVETTTADEVIDAEKKTRVTVTVSTEGDKPADVAAPTAVAEEKEEDAAPEEVVASANSNDTAEEIVEKAVEPTPAPSPAPAPAPEPAPAPKPDDAPKAPEADSDKSSRYKSGVSDQVLVGINGILADLTDEDRDAVLSGLGVQKDGEPVVEEAPISDTEVTLEVVQEAPAEVAVEAAPDVVAEDAAATSLEEVAAIAKSALDAAIAAQQEVVAVKSVITELAADKAKVEGELAKALDLVGRLINVPMGRKHATVENTKSTNGEKAPWLDPFIARLLDAQE
jgi:hypothetical protein